MLREEFGDRPSLAEYVHRFPQYASQLQRQFLVHHAMAPSAGPSDESLSVADVPTTQVAPGSRPELPRGKQTQHAEREGHPSNAGGIRVEGYLLTGRPPFSGTNAWDTLEQVRCDDPVPPGRLQPKVPRDLETICLKCLQKQPVKRYASAILLAQDLTRFLGGEPVQARRVTVAERCWKWAKRRPAAAALSRSCWSHQSAC